MIGRIAGSALAVTCGSPGIHRVGVVFSNDVPRYLSVGLSESAAAQIVWMIWDGRYAHFGIGPLLPVTAATTSWLRGVFILSRNKHRGGSLGLNRGTCAQWTRKRGLSSKRARHKGYDEFLRLRGEGAARLEAAASAGGSETMPYPAVPVARLEARVSARYLSLQERETIRDMVATGSSMRAISPALGREPSTISRENVKQQKSGARRLSTLCSSARYRRSQAKPEDSQIGRIRTFATLCAGKLLVRWSPEQISKTLIKEFPDGQEVRVAHETIYQSLYLQGRSGLRREIAAALRTGRARRKTHRSTQKRTSRFVDPPIDRCWLSQSR